MEQKETCVEDKKMNSKDEKINESEEFIRICSRLDDITVTFFEILTKIFSCRKNIDSALTDGYIRMAKARYTMGARSVTSLQYHEDDLKEALVHVRMTNQPDGSLLFDNQINAVMKTHSKADDACLDSELDNLPISSSVDNEDRSLKNEFGLRRRLAKSVDVNAHESEINGTKSNESFQQSSSNDDDSKIKSPNSSTETTDTGVKNKEHSRPKDPLLWFGVLVPQSLRQSQEAFKKAVELSCELASLQNQLVCLQVSYQGELLRKRQLVGNDDNRVIEKLKEREI